MVGGEAADFEAAKPVLEAAGKTIVHVGPAGSGQTVNRESAHRRRQHRTTGRGHRVPRSLRCGHRGSRRDVSRRSASSITCTSRWYSAQSSPTKIIDPSPFGKAVQPLSSPRTPRRYPNRSVRRRLQAEMTNLILHGVLHRDQRTPSDGAVGTITMPMLRPYKLQTSNRDVVVSGTELNSVDGHRRRHGR